jgi:hypothetical protein
MGLLIDVERHQIDQGTPADEKQAEHEVSRMLLEGLLKEFVETFPIFNDKMELPEIGEVCLFKKIQLLLSDLYLCFRVRFAFYSTVIVATATVVTA